MRIKVSFDKRKLIKYRNRLSYVQKQIIKIYLKDMSDYVLSEAQRNLREEPETKAFDTGALTRSGTSRVEGPNKTIVGFGGEEAKDYVLPVEFGTPPGIHPPVAPLIAWAKRIGIPKPERVAWAIAKKIQKEGLPSRPFLRNAVESAFREAPRIWKDAHKSYSK